MSEQAIKFEPLLSGHTWYELVPKGVMESAEEQINAAQCINALLQNVADGPEAMLDLQGDEAHGLILVLNLQNAILNSAQRFVTKTRGELHELRKAAEPTEPEVSAEEQRQRNIESARRTLDILGVSVADLETGEIPTDNPQSTA